MSLLVSRSTQNQIFLYSRFERQNSWLFTFYVGSLAFQYPHKTVFCITSQQQVITLNSTDLTTYLNWAVCFILCLDWVLLFWENIFRVQYASDICVETGIWRSNIPVEIGGPRACDLLLALSYIEKHGLIGLRPLEVKAFLDAIGWRTEQNIIMRQHKTINTLYAKK